MREPGRSKLLLCVLHLVWGSLAHLPPFFFFLSGSSLAAVGWPLPSSRLSWNGLSMVWRSCTRHFSWLPDWLGSVWFGTHARGVLLASRLAWLGTFFLFFISTVSHSSPGAWFPDFR